LQLDLLVDSLLIVDGAQALTEAGG